jgi:hypothetical protein
MAVLEREKQEMMSSTVAYFICRDVGRTRVPLLMGYSLVSNLYE